MEYSSRHRPLDLPLDKGEDLRWIHWVAAEFRHIKIVQSPLETYFNVSKQLQKKMWSCEGDYLCFLLDKPSQSTC